MTNASKLTGAARRRRCVRVRCRTTLHDLVVRRARKRCWRCGSLRARRVRAAARQPELPRRHAHRQCVWIGLLFRYALGTDAISLEVRALLTTGFCGGYTTFSTFSYDTMLLFEDGQSVRAGTYVVLSVALSLAATWLGIIAARALLAARSHG